MYVIILGGGSFRDFSLVLLLTLQFTRKECERPANYQCAHFNYTFQGLENDHHLSQWGLWTHCTLDLHFLPGPYVHSI